MKLHKRDFTMKTPEKCRQGGFHAVKVRFSVAFVAETRQTSTGQRPKISQSSVNLARFKQDGQRTSPTKRSVHVAFAPN
jgi:hypothetical protein